MVDLPIKYVPLHAPILKTTWHDAAQQGSITTDTVSIGVENVSEFQLHSYLAHYDSQFWCMWSSNPESIDDYPGQRIKYSTSSDGLDWATEAFLTPAAPSGYRWIARGFWKRGSELIALCSLDDGDEGVYFGTDLELRGFVWSGSAWVDTYSIIDGYINNFPPEQLPNGDWIMAVRDPDSDIFYAVGDIGDWALTAVNEGSFNLNEPNVNIHDYNILTATFRPESGSNYLVRAVSKNGGVDWTDPIATNLPDGISKHFMLRLSNDRWVLISNVIFGFGRDKIHISSGDDGMTFDQVRILREEATSPNFPNPSYKIAGYQYPHAIEHNGYLYIVYSENKEDILVSRIALTDL